MPIDEYIPALVTIRTVLDIVLVFIIVYVVLRLLRGTRAVPTIVGIVILALLYWLALAQDLRTLEFVLRSAVFYIGVMIIVLFQSEIRQALIYFGNRLRLPLIRKQRGELVETVYDEIVLAVTTLSSSKTGALIVVERDVGLRNFIDAGVQIDAAMSYDLLVTIFDPTTPLHDGAVIIRQERIAAASCFLPLTKNPSISRELGTRHRAAIGITEGTDCISIVVSEETGLISFIENGQLERNLTSKQLKRLLLKAMDIPFKDEEERLKASEQAREKVNEADSKVTV